MATGNGDPMTRRVFNFNAGPGALPLAVLEHAREELLDYRGTGMSVMEMSHRSKEFEEILERAERGLRRHLGVPEDFAVIFLQGGGSLQFAMVPMNLCLPGRPVDVLHTGAWTAKAMGEIKKLAACRLAASTEAQNFRRVPRAEEIEWNSEASYVYLCSNNTIEGTQWQDFPDAPAPLVADMSSDILSRRVDLSRFGLVFAGAQKNLGPSGVTLVIVRRDLAERADKNLPTLLQYRTHIQERSLYHTPPTFAIYLLGLMMDWVESEGGIGAIESRNEVKAQRLYQALDASGFYACPVEKNDRSRMNVIFRVAGGGEAREKKLVTEAAATGLVGLEGHRSVGGLRASLYNGVTLEAVEALVAFLREFERNHG
jgi:phosphoserine aminotransferase